MPADGSSGRHDRLASGPRSAAFGLLLVAETFGQLFNRLPDHRGLKGSSFQMFFQCLWQSGRPIRDRRRYRFAFERGAPSGSTGGDRLYFYGEDRPLHVSVGPDESCAITGQRREGGAAGQR
jgi:hypothetical protein